MNQSSSLIRYQINHTTAYHYSETVSVCHNEAYLIPRNSPYQNSLSHRLLIAPTPSVMNERVDYFGNVATCFSFNEGYRLLKIKSISRVEMLKRVLPAPAASPAWAEVINHVQTETSDAALDAFQFLFASPRIPLLPELSSYALDSFTPQRPIVEALQELTGRIFKEFTFNPAATTVTTDVREVFQRKEGVCQDFAHLQIACLRSIGLPARYVSGYLLTRPPPGQPRLIGADASHAWVSVYCGQELGWVDVDPTNNLYADLEHITVAWGRDYSDVCPVKGVYTGGGKATMNVEVTVSPLSGQAD